MATGCVFAVFSWAAFFTLYFCFLMSALRIQTIHCTILRKKDWSHLRLSTVIHGFRCSVVTLLRIRVNFCLLLGFLAHRLTTFLASSLACYPNSVVGFRLVRLLSWGDISANPVPAPNCDKNLCSVCWPSRDWSCSVCVITTSKNLPFSDIRNPSSGLDRSSDADTSILNESSDNINIIHVLPTPSPNSNLSTCQLLMLPKIPRYLLA